MFPTQLTTEETGHNPDVLIAALVHNREKDKFLVAKRRGTLGKGGYLSKKGAASRRQCSVPAPFRGGPDLTR